MKLDIRNLSAHVRELLDMMSLSNLRLWNRKKSEKICYSW